jgi:hypothetical protein
MADYKTEGKPPFINRMLTVAEWRKYVAGYDFGRIKPSLLVLHHTYSPDEASWRGLNTMRSMQRFYAGKGWTAGPHIYAGPDGIWLATPMSEVGIHAGNGNGSVGAGWYSIGLEMVGFFDKERPRGKVWEHAMAVMDGLSESLRIPMPKLLRFHRDFTDQKSCPGWAVEKPWVIAQIAGYHETHGRSISPAPLGPPAIAGTVRYTTIHATAAREGKSIVSPVAWGGTCLIPAYHALDLRGTDDPRWMHWDAAGFVPSADVRLGDIPPPPIPDSVSEVPDMPAQTATEAAGSASVQGATNPAHAIIRGPDTCKDWQMIEYLVAAKSPHYSRRDIEMEIISAYVRWCAILGVDICVAVGQLCYETDRLRSFWCARPQRNPAGLGVNGDKRVGQRPGDDWAYNPETKIWEAGLSFESWAQHAVPMHVARLAGYAAADSKLTKTEAGIIYSYNSRRPIPTMLRGSAPTIRELSEALNPTHHGWAPGAGYPDGIARHMEAIRSL